MLSLGDFLPSYSPAKNNSDIPGLAAPLSATAICLPRRRMGWTRTWHQKHIQPLDDVACSLLAQPMIQPRAQLTAMDKIQDKALGTFRAEHQNTQMRRVFYRMYLKAKPLLRAISAAAAADTSCQPQANCGWQIGVTTPGAMQSARLCDSRGLSPEGAESKEPAFLLRRGCAQEELTSIVPWLAVPGFFRKNTAQSSSSVAMGFSSQGYAVSIV